MRHIDGFDSTSSVQSELPIYISPRELTRRWQCSRTQVARALFAEVVRSREAQDQRLRQLHIADPNSGVIQKLVDLFVPCLGAHGHVFKYNGIEEMASTLE